MTVFLIPPQLEDSGEYACIAVNDVGVDVRRFTINIMGTFSQLFPLYRTNCSLCVRESC